MTPRISRAGRTDHGQSGKRQGDGGYTYASLLVLLVAISLAAQTVWIPRETVIRREKERELIFRGLAYRAAIRSYWLAGGDSPTYPPGLDALLEDPRQAGRKHIRRLYFSPFDETWTTIRAPEGGIAGVAPKSAEAPLIMSGYPPGLQVEGDGERYSSWQFVFQPEEE